MTSRLLLASASKCILRASCRTSVLDIRTGQIQASVSCSNLEETHVRELQVFSLSISVCATRMVAWFGRETSGPAGDLLAEASAVPGPLVKSTTASWWLSRTLSIGPLHTGAVKKALCLLGCIMPRSPATASRHIAIPSTQSLLSLAAAVEVQRQDDAGDLKSFSSDRDRGTRAHTNLLASVLACNAPLHSEHARSDGHLSQVHSSTASI